MIYKILKRIFRYAIEQYFSDIKVLHKDRIPVNKPLIILPNHRSAFMDPLVVATLLRPEVHFLARGESFTSSFMIRIYTALNMIPIYRKAYSPDEVHKNDDVFDHCFRLLEKKGALMIFPEGLSQTKFRLTAIKTGTARIALGAESKNNFQLDVQLLPVGINYTNPHAFRSSLVLDIGEPINVSNYQAIYQEEPEKAVRQVTSEIQNRLSSSIITLSKTGDADLIRRTELLLKEVDAADSQLTENEWYSKRKIIVGGINYFRENDPTKLIEFDKRVSTYLRRANLIDPKTVEAEDRLAKFGIKNRYLKGTILILIFPFFVFGLITHLLPFVLTKYLAKAIVKRTDFMGSVRLALGVLVFTVFIVLEAWLVYSLTASSFIALFFMLIWPSIGLFTYTYFFSAKLHYRSLNARVLGRTRASLKKYLVDERTNILRALQMAYDHYSTQEKLDK
jgi:glycerol-3-phosphate O-acyltransferase / dihydroxyacetone phosphate acyltransferase